MYFLYFLIVAWLLTLVGFEEHFLKGASEILDKNLSVSSYYVLFFAAGLIIDLIRIVKSK